MINTFSIKPPEQQTPALAIPEYLQETTYPALTGIRGLAIILVLLYHLGINHFLRQYNSWLTGRAGVDIFFVLSGFLISTLLIKEKINNGQVSLKNFYARRALRILPLAYLFLLVMICLNLIFHLDITRNSLFSGFLFLKNLPIANAYDHWTEHFWSLSVEEQFYLFFPLLIIWMDLNKLFILINSALSVVLFFSLLGVHHVTDGIPLLHSISHVMMYVFWEGPFAVLVGCLFSILAFKEFIPAQATRNSWMPAIFLLVLAVLIRSPSFRLYSPYLSEFIADLLSGLVIMLSIRSTSLFTRLLCSCFFKLMGKLSYSIYIWQQLFIWMPIRLPASLWSPNWNARFLVTDLQRLAGILLLSALSYYFFEKKFLKIKTHFL